jgi:hypothetical protein
LASEQTSSWLVTRGTGNEPAYVFDTLYASNSVVIPLISPFPPLLFPFRVLASTLPFFLLTCRSMFVRGGAAALNAELNMDQNRLWQRNLGRDDR